MDALFIVMCWSGKVLAKKEIILMPNLKLLLKSMAILGAGNPSSYLRFLIRQVWFYLIRKKKRLKKAKRWRRHLGVIHFILLLTKKQLPLGSHNCKNVSSNLDAGKL